MPVDPPTDGHASGTTTGSYFRQRRTRGMWEFTQRRQRRPWQRVDTPVAVSLHDVAVTADGPCAVGNGGSVVARAADGTWGVVVENGPSARGRALRGVDVTDDGKRLWFAGASGAIGAYDLESGTRLDRSKPRGLSKNFGAFAVAGSRGSEKLLVADGSGHVLAAEARETHLDWEPPTRPSGDTAIAALDATPDDVGYAVDSNANVYRTTATEGWSRVGVDGAGNSFYAVAASADTVVVGGGNGRVYATPTGSGSWTPSALGDFTVRALAATGGHTVAAGTGGTICSQAGTWHCANWGGSATINGLALGPVDVAVGNNGLLLERHTRGDRSGDSPTD